MEVREILILQKNLLPLAKSCRNWGYITNFNDMSVTKSLWVADIPYRKYAYGGFYLGKFLAIAAIMMKPTFSVAAVAGIGMILFSTGYLADRLYHSGFRLQSLQFSLIILLLCAATILSVLFYRLHI